MTAKFCLSAEKHTPQPDGYLAWHAWAEKKSKTHRQERCPGCGLLQIWVPKKSRRAALAYGDRSLSGEEKL